MGLDLQPCLRSSRSILRASGLGGSVSRRPQGLVSALFLALRLPQPLLLEGEAGVGKTEAAKALASNLGTA